MEMSAFYKVMGSVIITACFICSNLVPKEVVTEVVILGLMFLAAGILTEEIGKVIKAKKENKKGSN